MRVPSPVLVALGPELRRLDRGAALARKLDDEAMAKLHPLVSEARLALDALARRLEAFAEDQAQIAP